MGRLPLLLLASSFIVALGCSDAPDEPAKPAARSSSPWDDPWRPPADGGPRPPVATKPPVALTADQVAGRYALDPDATRERVRAIGRDEAAATRVLREDLRLVLSVDGTFEARSVRGEGTGTWEIDGAVVHLRMHPPAGGPPSGAPADGVPHPPEGPSRPAAGAWPDNVPFRALQSKWEDGALVVGPMVLRRE